MFTIQRYFDRLLGDAKALSCIMNRSVNLRYCTMFLTPGCFRMLPATLDFWVFRHKCPFVFLNASVMRYRPLTDDGQG